METSFRITSITARDIRFPTSLEQHGSDAVNNPDYACAYVTIVTDSGMTGFGLTFTAGRGTELICSAVKIYGKMLIARKTGDIFSNFAQLYHELSQEPQLRWVGPEKGVTHLALAAVMNALWDLWARIENKPLWKLLVDMEPEKLVSAISFKYITDVLTPKEAIDILHKTRKGRDKKENEIKRVGYPAYTMATGWLGYTDEKVKQRIREALGNGFTKFKVKVGVNLENDIQRLELVRKEIGDDKLLMTDANQRWDVEEAIEWMKQLTKFSIYWIEEPTSPDDILGHAKIAKALKPYGIRVATGECCQNRIVFKQFLEAKALDICQIDSARLAGPTEILAVYLMAHKFEVPVCPHAGGVGLCEYVQHLQIFDYIALSGTTENRIIEYADHLHEHFVYPVVVKQGFYHVPVDVGYSAEMKEESLAEYEYPHGSEWQKLFQSGKFKNPNEDN